MAWRRCRRKGEIALPQIVGSSFHRGVELPIRSIVSSAAKISVVVAAASLSLAMASQAEVKKPPPRQNQPAPPPRVQARPPAPFTRAPTTTTRTNIPTNTNIPARTTFPNRTVTTPNGPGPQFRRLPTGPVGSGPARTGPVTGGPALRPGPGPAGFGLRPGPGGPIATPLRPLAPNFPAVTLNNRFYPIVKDRKFMYFGGVRRAFIPFGLLGAALIGTSYWYPAGYVSVGAPYCSGVTPDGCELYWRMVDFEDGGAAPQCVQYCPQAGPPPAQYVTLPPPPPPPAPAAGDCQLMIFAQPNFTGTSAPTGDNQPDLSQSGWQDAISSIQVQSGTWEFFSAGEFGGDSMRLAPGTYPTLPPEWTKKINSFMCVEPGPGA